MKNIFYKTISIITILSIISSKILAADVINEGVFVAPGSVIGNLFNNNIIKFGEPAKVLSITGNFISAATSHLEIVTIGNIPNSIAVVGKTVLAGDIVMKFDPGYTPTIGDVFEVITSTGEISGTFTTITLENLPAGMVWQTNYNTNSTNFKIVSATPLPIKLISFNAKVEESKVELNWTTSSESNSAGFDIERSETGKEFTKIGFVKSDANNGKSNEKLSYEFTDASALFSNQIYYRLKQLDLDGKFEYSQIKSVKMEGEETVKVFPNPVSDFLLIETACKIKSVELLDTRGSSIYRNNTAENKIDMSNNAPGIYFLKIEKENRKVEVRKVLKN